ncbi:LytR/AlgR family response regulator transcription factor [Planctobacterium marinum]|uniref:DNA-binding response regulator n=1 Tax=Planctobacterium marinum TaxID=1631968 RepID=A0AA48HK68_9ALTE|nr:DNA-binding response regulator [Planctobacterium marinum]
MKVLVVDDEQLSQKNLQVLLEGYPEVTDIAFASNGNQAIEVFQSFQPEMVFLDIEMPGKSGLEVAKALGEQAAVVFVTAYDQYAISAFELNAIDYLLKPFDDARFEQAFTRAREQCQKREQRINFNELGELFDAMQDEREQRYKSRIVIKDLKRIRLVNVCEVNYILGAGNYVEIHLDNGQHFLHREAMNGIENQLNPRDFIRIHRSSIVRISYISELLPNERGDYKIRLKNGLELTVSRANKHKLLSFIQD